MRNIGGLVGGASLPSGLSGPNGASARYGEKGNLKINSATTGESFPLVMAANLELPLHEANKFTLTLTGACQLELPADVYESDWSIVVAQDALGGHALTFGAGFKIINDSTQPYPHARTLVQIMGVDGEYHISTVSLAPAE